MIISNLIGIIADDLTGANDTALQFHLRGANTQIVLDYEAFLQNIKNTQVWAIATETRNLPVDVAYEKVKEVTKACIEKLNLEFFYKKVDSTIRGNIAAETLAMLDVLEWDAAIIVPAFPAEGRTTVGGYHLLKGIPVERTEVARDVHSPIFESHIPTLLKSQLPVEKKDLVGLIELSTIMKGAGPILIKLNELIKQGKKLIVADAVSITDIEQIVLSINKSDYNILPAGSAACAQVLGNVWLPELKNQHITKTIPELPKLIISGSATQLNAAQIDKLEKSDDIENTYFIDLDMKTVLNGVNDDLVNRIVSNLGQNNIVVVHTSNLIKDFDGFSEDSLRAELTKSKLASLITDFLAELTKIVVNKKDLILITLGGETSYKCCRAIDSLQLQLVDEVAPSIALSIDHKAQWIVTKSGNLGNSNTLIDIVNYFEQHE
ncbi:MAG TPA: four-carbon acid sugar kinase family protein [Candidatus Gastranaerophilaceae bacterium]|nr:four-carbon acid sugar kinase family protein [Candidatus Gastranaerophilaceae bacterium]